MIIGLNMVFMYERNALLQKWVLQFAWVICVMLLAAWFTVCTYTCLILLTQSIQVVLRPLHLRNTPRRSTLATIQ